MPELTKPLLYNELTQSDVMQLSMDFEASPEAFEAARRFHGQYVDDIDELGIALQALVEQETAQNTSHAYYRQMEQSIKGLGSHRLGGVALGRAFRELNDQKQALLDSKNTVFASCEILSRQFATHMSARVPGQTKASLGGTMYEWDEGFVIVRALNKDGSTVLDVYGSTDLYILLSRKYLSYNSQRTHGQKETHLHIINPARWLAFLANLSKVAQL